MIFYSVRVLETEEMMKDFLAKIQNPLYLLMWLGLSLFMGYHHEPFSDEAQSYLIARDTSFGELIKDVLRMEGHPMLWYLWLKLFIALKINYEYIYFASIIPNFLGVWLFIKKAPFSAVVRYLFPLTYFIFYQYNIVARSYSFLLLFISLAAIYYQKRKEHPWIYMTVLMLLGQITAHTVSLAGCIFALGIYEDWKLKERNVTAIMIMMIYAILVIIMLLPNANNEYLSFISNPRRIIINTQRAWSCGLITFGGFNLKDFLSMIIRGVNVNDFLFMIIGSTYLTGALMEMFSLYRKEATFLLIPQILFSCYAYKLWHGGILILTSMLIMWLCSQKKISNELKFLIILLFCVQITWSIKAFVTDKKEPYSAGKEVYDFLNAQNIPLSRVQLLHFNATSICPYYQDKACSFWNWNKYRFAHKVDVLDIENYDAFIINTHRYKANPSFWDINPREYSLSLKIFASEHFVASYDASADETLYVYYRKKSDEK